MKQRQLTKEELDIAPKWATNYTVAIEGEVIFESKDFFQILKEGSLGLKFKQFSSGMQGSSQPIPPTKQAAVTLECNNSTEWVNDEL